MSTAARRVLIVDDDPDYRDHLHCIVGDAACAREPKEGLKLLADGDFDVVLLDQWYRNTSVAGTDVLAEYRRRAPLAAVVLMSMDYDATVAADGAVGGADFYVDKYEDVAMLACLARARLIATQRRTAMATASDATGRADPAPLPPRHRRH